MDGSLNVLLLGGGGSIDEQSLTDRQFNGGTSTGGFGDPELKRKVSIRHVDWDGHRATVSAHVEFARQLMSRIPQLLAAACGLTSA